MSGAPTVTGPHPSVTVGSCACCNRYDTNDGTAPHDVYDVRAWASTRLCRPCLNHLAAAIRDALDATPKDPDR